MRDALQIEIFASKQTTGKALERETPLFTLVLQKNQSNRDFKSVKSHILYNLNKKQL